MNACGVHIESELGHGNMTISLRALFDILNTIFDHEGPYLVLSVYLVKHFIRTNMTKRVNLGHERTAIFFCNSELRSNQKFKLRMLLLTLLWKL